MHELIMCVFGHARQINNDCMHIKLAKMKDEAKSYKESHFSRV